MIKQSFDERWEYTDQAVGMFNPMVQWQPVTLPHDESIRKPRSKQHPTGGAGGYAWSGVVTYRKTFPAPEAWRGQTVQLEFEGVYMNAEVSVNGQMALLHPYGYTSFLVDLTPYLNYGADNQVTVVANNSAQPNSRWYSGTGIYRHVWLRVGSGCHISPWGVFVTTPQVGPDAASVVVDTEIRNAAESTAELVLRSTVRAAGGEAVAEVETPLYVEPGATVVANQALAVDNPLLWSVNAPNLYALTSELLANGELVDTETTAFGIRTIAVDAQNGFRLNGVPLKLKGGCVHHDNGLLGAASYDRAEERKIELMKSAGYNAIRCAHNPPAPAMLDACDRLGMLVIDETFDCWRMGKNPNDYHLVFEDWWQRDTASMVKRDRNHPSVILWSIGNEVSERTGVSDGYAWAKKQADYVRALDPTRPVTSAVPFLFEQITLDPDRNKDENSPTLLDPDRDYAKNPPTPEEMKAIFDAMITTNPDPQKDRWGMLTRAFFETLDVGGYNYLCRRYEPDSERFPGRVMCGTETWPQEAFLSWQETARLPHVIGDFVWTSLDYLGESGIGKVTIGEPNPLMERDPWPYHLANCGDFDICGFKRPQSYYRDLLWGVRAAPYIAVLHPRDVGKQISFNQWGWDPVSDTWTFPGWEGKPARVDVYSADEEVELLVNGVSAGRKSAGAAVQNKTVFEVPYQPGEIVAVAYTGGRETARTWLVTAGAPGALRLTSDRQAIGCSAGDLAYVTVEIVDANGVVVQAADSTIRFEIAGAGELLAVGAADPLSEDLYTGTSRKAYQGRLMAVVRSIGEAGEIVLKAAAEGLAEAEVRITAR